MEFNKNDFIKNKINTFYKNRAKLKSQKNKIIETYDELYGEDPINRIYENQRRRVFKIMKKNKMKRTQTYRKILGCDRNFLKNHIQKQFNKEMTFDNYGEWEIDHIIPISSFDLSISENYRKCFNYKNLQPLWKIDNLKKSNKINHNLTAP